VYAGYDTGVIDKVKRSDKVVVTTSTQTQFFLKIHVIGYYGGLNMNFLLNFQELGV
jgi:hypothetical protein